MYAMCVLRGWCNKEPSCWHIIGFPAGSRLIQARLQARSLMYANDIRERGKGDPLGGQWMW